MKKLWFKAKRYGWGWYPVSWEGWVVTAVYAVALAWSVGRFSNFVVSRTGEPFLSLLFPVLVHAIWVSVLVGSLMYIGIRTGEKPEWRWGDRTPE